MNKNQVKGTVKAIAGKVQRITGTLLGSRTQQAHGMRTQFEGKAERLFGDLREVAKDVMPKR